MGGKLSQQELSKTVDFCLNAFEAHDPEQTQAVMNKIKGTGATNGVEAAATAVNDVEAPTTTSMAQTEENVSEKAKVDPEGLSPEELRILKTIRARQMLRTEDSMNLDNFGTDAIDGFAPLIARGNLGLVQVSATSTSRLPSVDTGLFKGAKMEDKPLAEQQAPIAAH